MDLSGLWASNVRYSSDFAEMPPRIFHMYRREYRNQLSLEDLFLPFGGKLSGGNCRVKLAGLIPWDELEDDFASQYCKGLGNCWMLPRLASNGQG